MKSQTLSQFQAVVEELDTFARKAGSKDRMKRKARVMGNKLAKTANKTANRISKSANQAITNPGAWLGNPVQKAKAGFQSNSISAAAGRSQNAAIKSTGSLGNTARKLGAAAKNVAGTRAGKIGAGIVAGSVLAAGAASLLKKRTKKNK